MASYRDQVGFSPKCPHCPDSEEESNFVVGFDEHTVGSNGQYEIVCCQKCHKIVHMQCLPSPSRKG